MVLPPLSLLALCLASSPVLAATAGSFANGGNTLISAMMMFVGNDKKVYILDKAEGNAAQINGHPAWGSVWDFDSHQSTVMDVRTNTFCSSGMHLPNGSYVTFGGNGAVGRGGALGSQPNPGNFSAAWDSLYQDFDGTRAMRVLNPCTDSDDFTSSQCQWFDDPTVLSMQKSRWYSAAEATGTGEVVIIGGFVNGGYVNRNYPVGDPSKNLGAEYTYEYYPPRSDPAQTFQFLLVTSGLNAYAHTFLMPSGKLFVQANLSTVLWDYNANQEILLPDMPNGVARVYPASGAVAMLPLTPANNYTPTVLFCGGQAMSEFDYGDYRFPFADTWNIPASQDCQRITPEPQDGSAPAYVQDDNMLEGRTMGQFVILPDGTLLVVNGGLNGTAGYSANGTLTTTDPAAMPFGESLASGPVGKPAIYNPNASTGSRWSNQGLTTSNIARLYHSSAMLLADGSVLIAGSNPNIDVNTTAFFPTQYQAEIFYPPYFSASTRPAPTGMPETLSYGGSPFDITIPATSYSGSANDAADSVTVIITRGGFTTHAMNMGQRHLQLNNTYTVNQDGSITLHVAQPPPNSNLFQPGPAFMFVNVHGIPSNGTYLIVGNGQIGTQPTAPASALPSNVRLSSVSGSASDTNASIAVAAAAGVGVAVLVARRRRATARSASSMYPMSGPGPAGFGNRSDRASDSSAFIPLQQSNHSAAWNASTTSFNAYTDAPDPYASNPSFAPMQNVPRSGGQQYKY
ncbi:copper radical oxidase [Gymnopilus junonius]|uniref:Copper radical oxidase n=1 Tax=Gymnopilus junonius TaxID=109634 RepID=A0A9P5NIG7_GYMJU|nr:copper radical oxidase [Gymnopilus junonius]